MGARSPYESEATHLAAILQGPTRESIAVFAGGCVRDRILGRPYHDIDIATSLPPDEVMALLHTNGIPSFPKGESFGVVSALTTTHEEVEIATLRSDSTTSDGRRPTSVAFTNSLRDDAARRDFTINAMFWDPIADEFYDFFGGVSDCQDHIIRAVGTPSDRIREDHLRMLRAVRFASVLNFGVDIPLSIAIMQNAELITRISAERIAAELTKILQSPDPVDGISQLRGSRLIQHIIPEFVPTWSELGFQDPIHHPEGYTWDHTLMVLGELVELRKVHPNDPPSFPLLLAALLHDIGKPNTQARTAEGRITNYGHAEVGAEIAQTICHDTLKLPSATTHHVTELVKNHMKMHEVKTMRKGRLYRLMEEPWFEDAILLQHADAYGTSCTDEVHFRKSNIHWIRMHQAYLQTEAPPQIRPFAGHLVNGDTLIGLGFKPSPLFKTILNEAWMAQSEGQFTTAAEASKWVLANFDMEVRIND